MRSSNSVRRCSAGEVQWSEADKGAILGQDIHPPVGAAARATSSKAPELRTSIEPECGCDDLPSTQREIVTDTFVADGLRRPSSNERLYSFP